MMNSSQRKKESKRKIWGRYQDLMLVGDQGQVIPFQRFKNMATVVVIALIVSLILVAVLGILLAGSRVKFVTLKNTLAQTQQQLTKLRDEKDLLLTQIVIKKKQGNSAPPAPDPTRPAQAAPQKGEATAGKVPKKRPEKPALPEKAATPIEPKKAAVKLSADARQIKVSYQAERQLLSLSFRIYNTTKPKVPLSGRTVVVFKNQDDPPIKWLVVPRIQLVDGKPSGKKGKAFKINNYRTVKFKAYRQKAPVRYNMATVFIFSSEGELLLSKDHSFKIDVQPPPKPVIPAPKPVKDIPKPAAVPVKPAVTPVPALPTAPEVGADETVKPPSSPVINPAPSPAPQGADQPSDAPSGEALPTTVNPTQPEIPTETDASQTQGEPIPKQ